MLNVTDDSDFQVDSGIHAVKFGATWCGPCKRMEPTLAQLESEFSMIEFIAVDVEQVPSLAQKYRIRTVPTLVFLKDGQEVNRVSGLSLIEPLRKILRDLTKEEA
jgi:thioredoxin 1